MDQHNSRPEDSTGCRGQDRNQLTDHQEPLEKTRARAFVLGRPTISRDEYLLRRSTGRSLGRLDRDEPAEHRHSSLDAKTECGHEHPSRQAYLSRLSKSPKLETSELDRSLQLEPARAGSLNDEKYLLEREECSRIDSLNERLSRYIQDNKLRLARTSGSGVSLEFAELRKHLRD